MRTAYLLGALALCTTSAGRLVALTAGVGLAVMVLYDCLVGPAAECCRCVCGAWDPLDTRWQKTVDAFRHLAGELSATPRRNVWLAISAQAAAIGHLAAWLVGARTLRAALDDDYVEMMAARFRDCGCSQGREKLEPILFVGGPGGATVIRLVCPAVAAQAHAMVIDGVRVTRIVVTPFQYMGAPTAEEEIRIAFANMYAELLAAEMAAALVAAAMPPRAPVRPRATVRPRAPTQLQTAPSA